jgi:hypothetical protein
MPGRSWLRHPPRTIRSRPCPTRLPRFTNRWLALASIPAAVAISPTPVQCAECGGWHLTPEGDHPMTDRLTTQQLDEIASRAAGLYEYATDLDAAWQDEADQLAGKDVPALLAEIRRLQAELAKAAEDVDWLRCLEAAGVDNWEGIETAIEMREQ